jgi:iron complex outermembrane recepter protein
VRQRRKTELLKPPQDHRIVPKLIGVPVSMTLVGCICIFPSLALGQTNPRPPQARASEDVPPDNVMRIVVIGNRTIVTSLKDVKVEQTYDGDRAASYGVSTIGELLNQVTAENGDNAPSILVNGQPVADLGDISDFPIEAILRIEALPLGTAPRIGGLAGQRAYNIVLRPSLRSITTTASTQAATQGGWRNDKGEATYTVIAGQDRINLSLRAGYSDQLLESERDVAAIGEAIAYAAPGNLFPISGSEIDPALSAIVGRPVGRLGLSLYQNLPSLNELAVGADRLNPSNLASFRTLRGEARPYEATLSGNKKLTPWLSLSFNGRVNWSGTTSLTGLPAARFLLPANHPISPLTRAAILALNDPTRPLRSVSETNSTALSGTLNANAGAWRFTTLGRIDDRNRDLHSDRVVGASGILIIDAATNPFSGSLAQTIPIAIRRSRSKTATYQLSQDGEGPWFSLPAGAVRVRAGLSTVWSNQFAADSTGASNSRFSRTEVTAKAGISVPLTSSAAPHLVLPQLGETELSFDLASLDLGRVGRLERVATSLNWRPLKWLNIVAGHVTDARPVAPELLNAPTSAVDNVLYFDPLNNTSVLVTSLAGGAGNLMNESQEIDSLSITAGPLPKYNLQIGASYTQINITNQFGALPPPSTAVVTAFPERFVRDGNGTLVLVDNRPVNFASQSNREMRFTMGFTIPFAPRPTLDPQGRPMVRRGPPLTLQINGSHLILLESKTLIRKGLEEIDLLDGGAIGIGGGRPATLSDATIALTQGGTGVRISFARRGVSYLRTGSVAAPDLLTFEPVMKIDVRAFVDLGRLMPTQRLAKGLRVSLAIENLADDVQRVTSQSGTLPTSFQPTFLDPIGRTIMLELRKVF